jgi:hypothetical protein
MQAGSSIRLSVVLTTKDPWPRAATCLDTLGEQARDIGAEVLIVDGSQEGIAEAIQHLHPHTTVLRLRGANNFQMRAHGVLHARGEIVAITEDHCRVAPDWCQRVLDAHGQWPEAAIISGSVDNGSPDNAVDRAHHFFAHGNAYPPIQSGPTLTPALQANISYKRRVVPREFPEWGYMDWMLRNELAARGEQIMNDNRIRVWHVQPMSLVETCTLQFHDGRSVSAYRRRAIGGAERLLRIGVALSVMAPLLALRGARWVFPKAPALLLASFPLMLVYGMFRATGAAVGLAVGEGRSPWRVD